MSRAALWRQETNVQERDRLASEIFETAVHEGKEVSAPIALTIVYTEFVDLFVLLWVMVIYFISTGY